MNDLPEYLSAGERARLIPVGSDSNKEKRITSVFLSSIMAVEEYGRELLGAIGVRIGAKSKILAFTEVEFKKSLPGAVVRPDGLLVVTVGKRQWSALIEAKIGKEILETDQIVKYLQLAKMNNIDSLITISNQFAALPAHHPVKVTKSKLKGIGFYHWSWMFALTRAILLLQDGQIKSADQKYILGEVVRHLQHDSTGVSSFDQMNSEWKDLVLKVKSGARLSKGSTEVENTMAGWYQEERDLSLIMSRKLGRLVTLRMPRAHAKDPWVRLKSGCEDLAKNLQLNCILEVPDAAAPIHICADISRRTISCSMHLAAPQDKVTPKARINWIMRQLAQTEPTDVFVKAIWPGRAPDTQASLSDVRDDVSVLFAGNTSMTPQHFEVVMIRDLAGKFSGPRIFIEQMEKFVPEYYENVGQHLRAWVAPPPKLVSQKDPLEEKPPVEGKGGLLRWGKSKLRDAELDL